MCVFRKSLFSALFSVLFGICATNARAGVCFLPSGNCGEGGFSAAENIDLDPNKQCLNEGFKIVNCNEAQVKDGVCPYDERYALGCKCRSDLVKCTSVQDGVGPECDGKYIQCVCKPGMVACNGAQNGVGESCNGTYASCICKPGLETCSGLYVGVGDSCDGKYNSCRCRSDLKSCPDGQSGVGESCDGKYASCTCRSDLKTCNEVETGVGASCDGKYENCVCRTDLITCPDGQQGGGLACGGKYAECGCSDALVQCSALEDGVGASCGGKFESCKCKDSLTACTNNQIGVGQSCDGKYESCKCPDNWSACPYGAPSGAKSCSKDGQTVYESCNDKCTSDYQKIECKKYEDVKTCANDATMKICTPTCESRLAEAGYKVNEDVSGAVITKNTTFSTTNGKNFRSVEDFRSTYPNECSSSKRPKPTLTYQLMGSGAPLSFKTFDKINLNVQLAKGTVDLSGATIKNGTFNTSSNVFIGQGHYTFTFDSDSKRSFRAGKIQIVHGAHAKINRADMNITGMFVWNTSNVYINNTTFRADYLETITSDSRIEFAGSSTGVYVKNTFLGGIENFGGEAVYRRGAAIRVKDNASWYVSSGNVRMRDGALFCAGYGGRIWFSGGSFGGKYSDQYQGCRIYHKKDRTLSYGNWDPSDYTSWNGRGGC